VCRADFIERVTQYTLEQLGFLDEVSKDERTPSRCSGRLKKGRWAEKKQPFVRGRRTSTEALLTLDGIVAGTVVGGSMTKVMFLDYLEHNIVSGYVVAGSTALMGAVVLASQMFCISRTIERPSHG